MARKKKMSPFAYIVSILVSIGMINWGLCTFGFNLVDTLLNSYSNIVYFLIGAAGIISAIWYFMNMPKMKNFTLVIFWLGVVSSINWLLNIFGYNLLKYLPDMLAVITYFIIGIAGIISLLKILEDLISDYL